MKTNIQWKFECDGGGKTDIVSYAFSTNLFNISYHIDIWEAHGECWCEVRCDGDSVGKTGSVSEAVIMAEKDYLEQCNAEAK